MKKILYLMHIDWRWIKQRPQFLAEKLCSDFEVHVVYQYRYGNNGLQQGNFVPDNCILHPMYVIPKGDKNFILRKVNDIIKRGIVKRLIKTINPDFIYVCSPDIGALIPDLIRAQVIYDCMDNHSELSSYDKKLTILNETRLVNRADYILTSSQYLKDNVLPQRGCKKDKVEVVRNGYECKDKLIVNPVKGTKSREDLHLGYIGTISNWFDFDVIEKSLIEHNDIVYDLIGPVDDNIRKKHSCERIVFHGTVEHSELAEYVRSIDLLIMPFCINEIVKAVDPVKLYEYIFFNKDILCIQYDEVNRFEKFVYFYKNIDEYNEAIYEVKKRNKIKYSMEERERFLRENTWENRANQIKELING